MTCESLFERSLDKKLKKNLFQKKITIKYREIKGVEQKTKKESGEKKVEKKQNTEKEKEQGGEWNIPLIIRTGIDSMTASLTKLVTK